MSDRGYVPLDEEGRQMFREACARVEEQRAPMPEPASQSQEFLAAANIEAETPITATAPHSREEPCCPHCEAQYAELVERREARIRELEQERDEWKKGAGNWAAKWQEMKMERDHADQAITILEGALEWPAAQPCRCDLLLAPGRCDSCKVRDALSRARAVRQGGEEVVG